MAVVLRSVGIDVGTSTTQVVFSAIALEDRGGRFTAPDIVIGRKEVLYRGPVLETPLLDERHIDAPALRRLVEGEFRSAGVPLGGADTGAVIVTGESARKENAAAILEQLSGFAGDFVAAAAGPDLESRIAGQGSGAQARSETERSCVANLDIGGGTTNIAVFDCGKLCAVGCYDIGGRQLKFSSAGVLTYLSESASIIAQAIRLSLRVSQTPPLEELRRLARAMARLLEDAISGEGGTLLARVQTAGSSVLAIDKPVEAVCFSGGVADCVYTAGQETFAFGDFGVLLGEAVRESGLFGCWQVLAPAETIRATVIGAGSFTLTLSGSTVRYTDAALFPMRNIPIYVWDGQSGDLSQELRWFLRQNDADNAAVAFEGIRNPTWWELRQLAQALAPALDEALPPGKPMIILLRHDMGKALGQAIVPLANGRPVIALDGIAAGELQYIDLGKPVMGGAAVPVVVKTLLVGG